MHGYCEKQVSGTQLSVRGYCLVRDFRFKKSGMYFLKDGSCEGQCGPPGDALLLHVCETAMERRCSEVGVSDRFSSSVPLLASVQPL